ncbi:DEAD/DEAH box helicase [Roseibacillus ishigakijimensis]|uniref:DEAD/DEAH box helicase n=1 Tax=Roseibacillus ishigakijimensis TaxID=454146 RepID=A0A934RQJ3_9BACT|nr:DEAD/DEAH box helicase [Roseibacillus ishigakijimensis]MBK1832701.1 DEAD/DEAH box helicase [Roseibacillus ishigakijimensis]
MSFADLGLSEPILRAVTEKGYTEPTPIQAQAIPIILEGRDLTGASQTGTGKTAAFALPSLSRIEKMGKPQILVLEPTRELAHQVAEQFEEYGKHTGLKVALLYGGVGYGKQDQDMKEADIVVATPGRLVDHFYRATMRFGEVKILILDEVDRMLDMGFLPIVRKIVNLCPWKMPAEEADEEAKRAAAPATDRQTLFFSATMPPAIEQFAKWCLTDPAEVQIARREVASTVSHAFYPVSMDQRDELLLALLKQTDFASVMVFTRTRKEADSVTAMLKGSGHDKVAAMHSDINQRDRMKALAGFKDGTYDILVATDVAARGIDVSGVTHVINYRVPENAEDYVHRIGRTGRAEKEGDAFTILTADELDSATSIENFISRKIERKKLEDFNYIYTALLDDSPPKPVRKKRPAAPKRRRR